MSNNSSRLLLILQAWWINHRPPPAGTNTVHWVAAALTVVSYILQRFVRCGRKTLCKCRPFTDHFTYWAKTRIPFFCSSSRCVPTSLISSEPLQSYPLSPSIYRSLSHAMQVVLWTQLLPSETNQKHELPYLTFNTVKMWVCGKIYCTASGVIYCPFSPWS